MTVLAPPLDAISRQSCPYPAYLLPHGGTGLLLFCAAFNGTNDAVHFARKDMTCTAVDRDALKLEKMSALYPSDWAFVAADAWKFAVEASERAESWDSVSVDPFTGDAGDRALETLELWCALATSLVTVTVKRNQDPVIPSDWFASRFPRARDVEWLVLRRNV